MHLVSKVTIIQQQCGKLIQRSFDILEWRTLAEEKQPNRHKKLFIYIRTNILMLFRGYTESCSLLYFPTCRQEAACSTLLLCLCFLLQGNVKRKTQWPYLPEWLWRGCQSKHCTKMLLGSNAIFCLHHSLTKCPILYPFRHFLLC